ncbi:hypothetical protein [Flavobacterium caseinilyticum]|uniref:Uncharacterized protein n=1 Tax=Flavobacterium caseinilyticum TaxID=2541732 RepID=A0A4R5AVL2_9FLAO|nr:hypothetical protein [Flavobacterium caseinilyticum]TDD77141.1 hypothetical protein E0F89_05955 [Flavobacterium caseinilyticum]
MKNFGVLLICTMIITVGDYFRKTPEAQPYTEPKIMNLHIIKREHVRDSIFEIVKANAEENSIEIEEIKKRLATQKSKE